MNIEKLEIALKEYKKAKQELLEVNNLVKLSTATGHSDGRWQPRISINCQVAYQKNIGGNNYHNSNALNREMEKIVSRDLCKIRQEAIEKLQSNNKSATDNFDKYKEVK